MPDKQTNITHVLGRIMIECQLDGIEHPKISMPSIALLELASAIGDDLGSGLSIWTEPPHRGFMFAGIEFIPS